MKKVRGDESPDELSGEWGLDDKTEGGTCILLL